MEELAVSSNRFKHDGLYSLSSYYNLLYDTWRSLGYDVEEIKYFNKLNPEGKTSELEIVWECTRKIDGYTRIYIRCKTLIVGMNKQQVQIDGKPVTRDSGVVELELKSTVQTDYDNKWVSNVLLESFRKYYDMFFYKPTLDVIKGKASSDHYSVENEMKAFFNMQRFM